MVPFSGKSILSWIDYAEGHFGATSELQEAYADRKKDIGDNQNAAGAVGPLPPGSYSFVFAQGLRDRIQRAIPATSAMKQTSRMNGSRSVQGSRPSTFSSP
jgi:hypothetical protein